MQSDFARCKAVEEWGIASISVEDRDALLCWNEQSQFRVESQMQTQIQIQKQVQLQICFEP